MDFIIGDHEKNIGSPGGASSCASQAAIGEGCPDVFFLELPWPARASARRSSTGALPRLQSWKPRTEGGIISVSHLFGEDHINQIHSKQPDSHHNLPRKLVLDHLKTCEFTWMSTVSVESCPGVEEQIYVIQNDKIIKEGNLSNRLTKLTLCIGLAWKSLFSHLSKRSP